MSFAHLSTTYIASLDERVEHISGVREGVRREGELILDAARIGGARLAQLGQVHVVAAPVRVPNGVWETWTGILRWRCRRRRSALCTIREVRANVGVRWVWKSVVQKSDDHVVEEFGLL